jgi:hypothetical protein
MLTTVKNGCKYPNSALVNGIILNLYVDTKPQVGLITQLRKAITNYEQCHKFTKMNINNIFINFSGPGVGELIPNNDFWQEFRSYILSIINNQILQIKGIIIPYTYVSKNTSIISRKVSVGRLLPLILDTTSNAGSSCFYLEPSMLTNNTHSDYVESQLEITKAFNSNGFTHLMVSNDLMESNTVITERIEQYINFIRSIIIQNQKNAFSFMQMSNALAQYTVCPELQVQGNATASTPNSLSRVEMGLELSVGDTSLIDSKTANVISNKINTFNEQLKAQENSINKDSVRPQNTIERVPTGFVSKCKEYLLTYANKLLGVVGMSLVFAKA